MSPPFAFPCRTRRCTPQTWRGKQENWAAAQDILVKLAKANSEAAAGQFKGPHPVPGGGRILQVGASMGQGLGSSWDRVWVLVGEPGETVLQQGAFRAGGAQPLQAWRSGQPACGTCLIDEVPSNNSAFSFRLASMPDRRCGLDVDVRAAQALTSVLSFLPLQALRTGGAGK